MREVATFAMVGQPSADAADASMDALRSAIDGWLAGKGSIGATGSGFVLNDGRSARLKRHSLQTETGSVYEWELEEPIQEGIFITRLRAGSSGSNLGVVCALSAGDPRNTLSPVMIEARCPQVLRTIVDLHFGWRLGSSIISSSPLRLTGREGGASLLDLLQQKDRSLPVIVVSEVGGLTLHPQFAERMASDLTGLALVASVDDEVSWTLTEQLGKVWSCYQGAVRLYWPGSITDGAPFRHPLWTPQRLLQAGRDTEQAERRFRDQIRRRLFALSSFTVSQPEFFGEIERAHRQEKALRRAKKAEASGTDRELARLYAEQNDELRDQIAAQDDTIRQLRRELYALSTQVAWRGADPGAVSPDDEDEPSTVSEAISQARRRFDQYITFGGDVDGGVQNLAADAGPPLKILHHLDVLARLAAARREGELGAGMIGWLRDRGVTASPESDTISNDRREQRKRTWHDGADRRLFSYHLKPKEGTSPDHCVRIYFDWDDATGKMVVGWIGRHP